MNLPIPVELLEKAQQAIEDLPPGSLEVITKLVEGIAAIAKEEPDAALALVQEAERETNSRVAMMVVRRSRT